MERALGQSGNLTEIQRSVRDYFSEGGSLLAVLLVMGLVAIVLLAAYWLTRRQQRHAERSEHLDDPGQLFDDLLGALPLATPQREFLSALVREERLEQPSVILLSPARYDRCVSRHQGRAGSSTGDDQLVEQIRTVLFPKA